MHVSNKAFNWTMNGPTIVLTFSRTVYASGSREDHAPYGLTRDTTHVARKVFRRILHPPLTRDCPEQIFLIRH